MEEKAAEGNLAYFSEFSTEELEKRLKYRDDDGRTLVHICAAAGGCRERVIVLATHYLFPFFCPLDCTRNTLTPARCCLLLLAAGKTELLELFLANPKGRALVNKGDEVRDRWEKNQKINPQIFLFLVIGCPPNKNERTPQQQRQSTSTHALIHPPLPSPLLPLSSSFIKHRSAPTLHPPPHTITHRRTSHKRCPGKNENQLALLPVVTRNTTGGVDAAALRGELRARAGGGALYTYACS
jgi:hypothetical protein